MKIARVNPKTIPPKLMAMEVFINWSYVYIKDELKKIPINPLTRKAMKIDKEIPSDFKTAYNNHLNSSNLGVGVILGNGLIGVDIDHCIKVIDGRKKCNDIAFDCLTSLKSYSEYSPSGNGVHILLLAEDIAFERCKNSDIEIYTRDRFFTLTGNRIGKSDLEARSSEIKTIYDKHLNIKGENIISKSTNETKKVINIDKILKRIYIGGQSEKFIKLYEKGDSSDFKKPNGENNPSSADRSLARIISYYTDDAEAIRAIMLQSALYRDKYLSKRGNSDYLDQEIKKVLTTDFIDNPKNLIKPRNKKRRRFRGVSNTATQKIIN